MKILMKGTFFAATVFCAAIMLFAPAARAETTQCTPITTIPITITTQGIYCFTGNLAGNMASGSAIAIMTNNVTIDLNGYKLGNLAAGGGTYASGIYAVGKKNITIRNGTIRGFYMGLYFQDSPPYITSSGHLVYDLRMDGNTHIGMLVHGTGNIIRNNQIVNTGPSSRSASALGLVAYGPGLRVLNNDIIDVTEDTNAHGIEFNTCDGAVVAGNRISSVIATNTSGITINNSLNITVSENQIAGVAKNGVLYTPGSTGIYMGNTVSGSTTPFTGGSNATGTNFNN